METLDPLGDPNEIAKHLRIPIEDAEHIVAQHKLAAELSAADPSLGITALIIAGDRVSAQRWEREADEAVAALAAGTPLDEMPTGVRFLAAPYEDFDPEDPNPHPPTTPHEKAAHLIGSYARLDFAVRSLAAGKIRRDWFYAELPELWRGSDPDDTDPRFLPLWKEAFAANGNATIYDNPDKPLPEGPNVILFRGQDPGAPIGIAFSTNVAIAQKFANGAALRQSNRHGNLVVASVRREKVIAYLTGRGEAEAIVDPAALTYIENPVDGLAQR